MLALALEMSTLPRSHGMPDVPVAHYDVRMPPSLSDAILKAIEPVDATLFELVATGPNLPAPADVDAYEASLGFPLPTYFRELVLSPLGGLYVRAREASWPRPSQLAVVETGYFLRGIAILGMATDNPIERLDLRVALQQVQAEGTRDFAPVLVLDGDNGVYGFDSRGDIQFEVDGSISESDEQDFAALYTREVAGLIERQARYGRAVG